MPKKYDRFKEQPAEGIKMASHEMMEPTPKAKPRRKKGKKSKKGNK